MKNHQHADLPFLSPDYIASDRDEPKPEDHIVNVSLPFGIPTSSLHRYAEGRQAECAALGMGYCTYFILEDHAGNPLIQFEFEQPMAQRFLAHLQATRKG